MTFKLTIVDLVAFVVVALFAGVYIGAEIVSYAAR